jgi:hypothetical protein
VGWFGPNALDLGAVQPWLTSTSTPVPAATSGTYAARTFSDFRLASWAGGSGGAALVGGFFFGTGATGTFRAMGRAYSPVSTGGNGWAQIGQDYELIDTALATSMSQFALGFSYSGDLAAVFGTGTATQAAAHTGAGWRYFDQTDFNGAAPDSSISAPDGINGHATSIAWDPAGIAYYAQGNSSNDVTIFGNESFTGWSTIATEGTKTDSTNQTMLLSDGLGVTLLYLDENENLKADWSIGGASAFTSATTVATLSQPTAVQLSGTVNATSITGFNASEVEVGWIVTGGNFPAGTLVQTIVSATSITTSAASSDAGVFEALTFTPPARSYPFGAAADGNGDVVAAYLSDLNPAPTGPVTQSIPPTCHASTRLFGSVRTASGTWTGPTRLDSQFSTQTTSMFQQSGTVLPNFPTGDTGPEPGCGTTNVVGGIDFATPAVAYIGGGRFMVAFPMTDNLAHTGGIYVRGYTVGTGWDPTTVTLDLQPLGGVSDQYRYANELVAGSDGQGDVVLVAQYVLPSPDSTGTAPGGDTAALRAYGYKVWTFNSSGGWSQPTLFQGNLSCPAPTASQVTLKNYRCWSLKPQAVIFPTGETIVAMPAPDPYNSGTNLRLFSMEYHPQ